MKLISREELRRKLDRGDELKLVMALPAIPHRDKRIPGSLSFESVDQVVAALDPEDEVVVYCSDVHCPASIYVYALLEREGYRRLYRYAGGIDDWESAGYPVESGSAELGAAGSRRQAPRARAVRSTRRLASRRWPAIA